MTYQERKYQQENAISEHKNSLRKFKALCKKELITKQFQFFNWYKVGEIYNCNISEMAFITIINVFKNSEYPVCIEMSSENFKEYFEEITITQ